MLFHTRSVAGDFPGLNFTAGDLQSEPLAAMHVVLSHGAFVRLSTGKKHIGSAPDMPISKKMVAHEKIKKPQKISVLTRIAVSAQSWLANQIWYVSARSLTVQQELR